MSNVDTPIPATSPLPSRYRSSRNARGSRNPPSTTLWDHHITPTTGSLFLPVYNEHVTSVPTEPTVCVAYSSPVVSAITASSEVASPAGVSYVSGSQPPLTPSGPVPAEGASENILHTAENPNMQGPSYYYDANGQPVYISGPLPTPPMVEVSVLMSIAWGPSSYHGAPVTPQGPATQNLSLYMQDPSGQQQYGPQGQPF